MTDLAETIERVAADLANIRATWPKALGPGPSNVSLSAVDLEQLLAAARRVEAMEVAEDGHMVLGSALGIAAAAMTDSRGMGDNCRVPRRVLGALLHYAKELPMRATAEDLAADRQRLAERVTALEANNARLTEVSMQRAEVLEKIRKATHANVSNDARLDLVCDALMKATP